MRQFYEQAVIRSLLVLVGMAIVVATGHRMSYVEDTILPKAQAVIPWRLLAVSGGDGQLNTSADKTGAYLKVNEADQRLDFNFGLSSEAAYPFISVELRFNDPEPRRVIDHVDLSHYDGLRFTAHCDRPEVMTVVLQMFDEHLAADVDRLASYFFNCPIEPTVIEAKFRQFEVPLWWQMAHHIDLTDKQLNVDKVRAFAWGASLQTPLDRSNHVTITSIQLVGYREVGLVLSMVIAALMALAFIVYLFKLHSIALRASLTAKQERDKPLVAYQKVVLESHRDKERSTIVGYIAQHYTDPELTLEQMTQQVGISRTKVNEIIKNEIGLTFTAYVNKLRLTEASRLLKENTEASVSEVAFAVGYNNVSYFNKLFKAEYGCTPKSYRQH